MSGTKIIGYHQDEFALKLRTQEAGEARSKAAFDLAMEFIAAAHLKVADRVVKGFSQAGLAPSRKRRVGGQLEHGPSRRGSEGAKAGC